MSSLVTAFIRPPSRRGSTKVSRPTALRIPGCRVAPARCIWNSTPDGRLYASISSRSIICQTFGGSALDGPLG
jgi:hypothetical protein